jgi:hypothetical protein
VLAKLSRTATKGRAVKTLPWLVLPLILLGCIEVDLPPTSTPPPTALPAFTASCDSTTAIAYLDQYDPIYDEWLEVYAEANYTGPSDLSPIIARMEGLKRRVADLDPPCQDAADLQAATVTHQGVVIAAFLSFQASKPDAPLDPLFDQASTTAEEVRQLYAAFTPF